MAVPSDGSFGLSGPLTVRTRLGGQCFAVLLPLLALSAWACRRPPSSATRGEVLDVVRAHKFVLVDRAGVQRAELTVEGEEGVAHLTIRRQGGGPSVSLALDKEGQPSLRLVGADGAVLAELAAYADGESWLITLGLGSVGGKPVAELGAFQRGPVLVLRDQEGNRRVALTVAADGASGIALSDGDGSSRCTISLDGEGRAGVKLKDGAGRVRANLMVHTDGQSALDLLDSVNQRVRVSLVAEAAGECWIALHDAEGRVIWTAPGATPAEGQDERPPAPD